MRKTFTFLFPAVFFTLSKAHACSVCFGNPDSLQSKALTGAVLFLLAVVTVVLIGIASLLIQWSGRARRLEKTPSIS